MNKCTLYILASLLLLLLLLLTLTPLLLLPNHPMLIHSDHIVHVALRIGLCGPGGVVDPAPLNYELVQVLAYKEDLHFNCNYILKKNQHVLKNVNLLTWWQVQVGRPSHSISENIGTMRLEYNSV